MWRSVVLCVWVSTLASCEEEAVVSTLQGKLEGVVLHTRGGRPIKAFLGIPYASPPVGPLRFQKPLPAGSWDGARNASMPGSPCLQSRKGIVLGSEDCLYLNVYTHKASNETTSPVLMFIHGGGFSTDWAHLFQPDFLMDKDIVLVTINYRLGVLGFLSMEDKDLPGNNGLKDQTMALTWVKKNIAQFGGDPGAITICGGSAGAASVHLHMLSPLSKGLFHRAIAHSGSAYCPWAIQPKGQSLLTAEKFAAQLGCNHFNTRDTLDCLRDMPAYVLVDVAQTMHEWHQDPAILFPPSIEPEGVEDAFLTKDPWKLSSDIPWITGVTSNEGIFKANTFDSAKIIELNDDFEIYGPLTLFFRATAEDELRTALAIKKFYFFDSDIKVDNIEGLSNMYSDSWFIYPVKESVRRHKGPTFFYYFGYRGANSIVPENRGVSHFDDMQYFFPMNINGTFFNLSRFNESSEDREMSEKLIELWTNFVIHGKPSLDSSWKESDPDATHYLHIKKDGFVMEKNLLPERDRFWSELAYRDKYTDEDVKDEL